MSLSVIALAMRRRLWFAGWATLCLIKVSVVCAEPATITLTAPKPRQVVQRVGFDRMATAAAQQKPGGAALGFADISVRGDLPEGTERATWEYRVVPAREGAGAGTDWTKLDIRVTEATFATTARVLAGGWYRLEIRGRVDLDVVARGAVEPIGVGEVFVVAGQSYATNCNDERFQVADADERVVAFDSAKETWNVAHDPQPAPDGSDGGSIWPPLGDALQKEFGVPIGFANVAVGATSSAQWMPEGMLHPRLVQAGKTLGRFRAVLWQQGESDVIAKTTAETYIANLQTIRESAAKAWGFEPPWLLAKSTLHPTVYNDPAGEGRIRGAIDELLKRPGFRAGPDTDTLTGENRGDAKSRRHFSGIGQRRAAEMWFAVLKRELATATPRDTEASITRSTQALFVSNDGLFRRYRIPSLLVSKKGTLLAICEGRVDGGGLTGNIDLVLRRSFDAGRTWQPLQKIADLGDDTAGNPCPVVDRETGTIWLPCTRSPGRFNETQIVAGQSSGPTTVWVTRSDDDGATWSEPRDISAAARRTDWGWYGTGPGIGIQLANGRMLIPSYHTEPGSGMYRSHAIFSDDHGATWKLGETVGEHTAECQAIERRDGVVVLNMRGTNKQFFRSFALSRDGGQSWSEPQLDRQLSEPACQASLLKMPTDGRAESPSDWLFCNPPGSTRRNLTLRVSRDEGQSWPIAKSLDAGPTEYSSLAWLPDGQIGLLYELSRAGQTYRPELHFARIPTGWLTDIDAIEPFVPSSNSR
ncbi:MAG: exo-alpha-sialidase [Planctomycetaceae bacterium]